MTAPLAAPPYALAAVEFPCPGLAALVARAPIGAGREVVLACITVARLAAGAGLPSGLPQEIRRERAEAARAWLSTLAVEPLKRAVLLRAISATAVGSLRDIADELRAVAEELASTLDQAATEDLARIAERLRR
jgi:hypothetical protein